MIWPLGTLAMESEGNSGFRLWRMMFKFWIYIRGGLSVLEVFCWLWGRMASKKLAYRHIVHYFIVVFHELGSSPSKIQRRFPNFPQKWTQLPIKNGMGLTKTIPKRGADKRTNCGNSCLKGWINSITICKICPKTILLTIMDWGYVELHVC